MTEPAKINGKVLANVEEMAMPVSVLLRQVALIQAVMKESMKENEHYGIIPGTKKPTLLKSGAEKLCLTFRLDPQYEAIPELTRQEDTFISYTIRCRLVHIITGNEIATGIGSCNSREAKYRWRWQDTGDVVPKDYWKNRDQKLIGGIEFRPTKVFIEDANKKYEWHIAQRVENTNPWDQDNTIMKMACKRALVAATLNGTAASDIFTQDLEDMPSSIRDSVGSHAEEMQGKPIDNGEGSGKGKSQTKADKKLRNLQQDIKDKVLASKLLTPFEKWLITAEVENYSEKQCMKCLMRYSVTDPEFSQRITLQDKPDALKAFLEKVDGGLKEKFPTSYKAFELAQKKNNRNDEESGQ